MEELSAMENQVISTQEIHDSLLNSVQEIKLSMTESYEVVNTESKVLLNALQKLPTNDSREEKAKSRLSDYTEAASHVMDLIVIMYEQDKQSKILWEKTKLRITQKYNLYRFQQECDEVSLFVFFFQSFFVTTRKKLMFPWSATAREQWNTLVKPEQRLLLRKITWLYLAFKQLDRGAVTSFNICFLHLLEKNCFCLNRNSKK